ncbi:hypothetical protein HGG75_27980 [Ochrobactrum pseudogrignonense]|nr:hypothetical protein [Brucella pseudogrignonensis]
MANFDVAWIGGLSEALKVMHLADAFDRVIAPHDCTGPVTLGANVHLLAASTNGLICETVRAHTQGFMRKSLIVSRLSRTASSARPQIRDWAWGSRKIS